MIPTGLESKSHKSIQSLQSHNLNHFPLLECMVSIYYYIDKET